MSTILKVSNSLKELATHLSDDFHKYPKGIFQPVYIITQTDGMNNWLKYQLAYKLGIAANFRYLKSQEVINEIYFLLGGRFKEVLSTEKLSWILFKLLGEDSFQARFPDVAAYYTGDSQTDVKRIALAEKVADLFDQYQIYRPSMIQNWNHVFQEKSNEWQSWLWQESKKLLSEKLPDKTNISRFIIDELNDPHQQQLLQKKMPVIYLFGLSIITKYHVELYHALAQVVDMRLYLINPSPEQYWFEDRSEKQIAIMMKKGLGYENEIAGNPLLTSWGKVLQDTFSLLFEDEGTLNSYEIATAKEITPDTLLNKIKFDLYNNSPESDSFEYEDLTDGSITINSCYSPAREVEVLYNYLVQLTDKKTKHLSAREIVVMVSDINTYAPYIKAVFDNAPYKFPYCISDETYVEGDTISAALQSLLSITEENFTSENVIQLLDSSFIRKRFGITDVTFIREAVNKANIRFGIENDLADESVYVSWTYGLKRIMYGICIGNEEEFGEGPESFYPVDLAEGLEAEQLIRLNYFVEMLIRMLQARKQNRTIKDWVQFIESILENMVCEAENSAEEDHYILTQKLSTYNVLNEYFTDKVSYRVFIHNFLQTLESGAGTGSFVSSGITFCSLIPMRSIPFRVVAMLGLNFDQFPRKDQSVSFNLIDTKKQKGDRSMKENDKNLFLESLVAAEEFFYISYVGRNSKDNSDFPPSVLVDELVDYIQSGTKELNVRKLLIKKHPLHGFSRLYNSGDERLITYLNTETPAITDLMESKEINSEIFSEVPLEKFIHFFKNPFKGYYNDVLKIYYEEDDVLLSENELFELGSLEKWALQNELLSERGDEILIKDKLVKTGQLPLKNMGQVVVENMEEQISDVKELFQKCVKDNPRRTKTIEVAIGHVTIKGQLDLYGNKLVMVCFSKQDQKYRMEAYIKYLAAIAAGEKVELYFISQMKNNCYRAANIEKEEAQKRLNEIINQYQKGHQEILPFYLDFHFSTNAINKLDEDQFRKNVNAKLLDTFHPCSDPYILNEFNHGFFEKENILKNYQSVATDLLEPLDEIFPDYK